MLQDIVITTNGNGTIEAQAIQALRDSLRGALLQPGDAGYDDARKVWNAMIDKYPAFIARCTGPADVIAAVNFARTHRLSVAVRGGGHNVAGHATNDGGLVIDLSPMKGVWVDPVGRTVRAQGGVTWGELDRETQVFGLATPGGAVSTTGIAGLTLGGGIGHMRRKYGLSCDNLLAAEVVTADGQLIRASETENSDLFWALRGGGGNFGIVTSFEFKLHPVGPTIMSLGVMYPAAESPRILRVWREFMVNAPDEFSSQALIWTIPAVPFMPEALHNIPVVVVAGMYAGPADEGERYMQPLRELATPVVDLSGQIPYLVRQNAFDPFFPHGEHYHYWKSLNLPRLTDEALDVYVEWSMNRPSPRSLMDLWAMGGAVNRVAPDAMAYSERAAEYCLVFNTTWEDPADSAENIAWTRAFYAAMKPFASGTYVNFPGLPEDFEGGRSSYGANYERLAAVKTKYDPTNFFRLNQNIKPEAALIPA